MHHFGSRQTYENTVYSVHNYTVNAAKVEQAPPMTMSQFIKCHSQVNLDIYITL